MFNRKPKNEANELDKAINELFEELSYLPGNDEEYAKVVDQLSKLYSLKETESPKRVSPDVLATIAANLLGIIVIVGHERANVVTSKALGLLPKPR